MLFLSGQEVSTGVIGIFLALIANARCQDAGLSSLGIIYVWPWVLANRCLARLNSLTIWRNWYARLGGIGSFPFDQAMIILGELSPHSFAKSTVE